MFILILIIPHQISFVQNSSFCFNGPCQFCLLMMLMELFTRSYFIKFYRHSYSTTCILLMLRHSRCYLRRVTCVDTLGHVAGAGRHWVPIRQQETTELVITRAVSECYQVPGSQRLTPGIIIIIKWRIVSSSDLDKSYL